jgi:hypothetical protein
MLLVSFTELGGGPIQILAAYAGECRFGGEGLLQRGVHGDVPQQRRSLLRVAADRCSEPRLGRKNRAPPCARGGDPASPASVRAFCDTRYLSPPAAAPVRQHSLRRRGAGDRIKAVFQPVFIDQRRSRDDWTGARSPNAYARSTITPHTRKGLVLGGPLGSI